MPMSSCISPLFSNLQTIDYLFIKMSAKDVNFASAFFTHYISRMGLFRADSANIFESEVLTEHISPKDT